MTKTAQLTTAEASMDTARIKTDEKIEEMRKIVRPETVKRPIDTAEPKILVTDHDPGENPVNGKLEEPVTPLIADPTPKQELKPLAPAVVTLDGIHFNNEHLRLIREQIAKGATDAEFDLFIMMARRTRLDPLLKQLHFMKFRNHRASQENGCQCKSKDIYEGACQCGKSVWNVSYVTSIDGYRIIAQRTNQWAGIDEPQYLFDKKGLLVGCTVKVYRTNSDRPFAATVFMSEYDSKKNLWVGKPKTMIAKVAEAHALRKAFPQDLSGIYTTDEMDQAQNENAQPATNQKKLPQVPKIEQAQADEIKKIITDKELELDKVKLACKKMFNKSAAKELTRDEAEKLIAVLERAPSNKPKDPQEEEELVNVAADIFGADIPDNSGLKLSDGEIDKISNEI